MDIHNILSLSDLWLVQAMYGYKDNGVGLKPDSYPCIMVVFNECCVEYTFVYPEDFKRAEPISEEDFQGYEKWCEETNSLPWCCEKYPYSGPIEYHHFDDGGLMLTGGNEEFIVHIRKAPYEWQKKYIERWKLRTKV
jgi:hypothetical protein